MPQAVIRLWPLLARTLIRPEIYGHSAGQLGRCVYEGIWVGEDSAVPQEEGIRLDVLAALKQLRAPVLRWPGGGFAGEYHWRDGIGPHAERPTTVNAGAGQTDPNTFGVDEYIRCCRAIGAEPYCCVNSGSGTPDDARKWVEYCNFGGDSDIARKRMAYGRPAPYGVKYWNIGHPTRRAAFPESAEYARLFCRFGSYMKEMDPAIQLIASGPAFRSGTPPFQPDWEQECCRHLHRFAPDLMDHFAISAVFQRGSGDAFSVEDYQNLWGDIDAFETHIARIDAILRYYFPKKNIGVVIDEWGMRHPEATADNGFEQPNTLRDALLAGSLLNLFNRWAHRLSMATIAHTINTLQCMAMTRGNRLFLTPTYHTFELMRPHMGARRVLQEVEAPAPPRKENEKAPQIIEDLDVSASISGKKLHLTVINRSITEDITTQIQLREVRTAAVSGKVLTAPRLQSTNSFDHPTAVSARRIKIENASGDNVAHVFPCHSLTALTFSLE